MILAFISSLLVTDFFCTCFFHFFLIFSDLFGFGSCHGEGIGVSTEGTISTISTISTIGTVGTSIGVTSIGTSIGSMGVGRVGTVGTVVVGIGVGSNGDRGDSGGSDNRCDNMSRLNSGENRGNGEGDSASSVGIKDSCVSSRSLSIREGCSEYCLGSENLSGVFKRNCGSDGQERSENESLHDDDDFRVNWSPC